MDYEEQKQNLVHKDKSNGEIHDESMEAARKAFPGLTIDTGRVDGVKTNTSPANKKDNKINSSCWTNWPASSDLKASIPNIEILVRVEPER